MVDPLKIKTRWFRLFASALLTFAMTTASGCSDNRPVDEQNIASTAKMEPKTNTAETEIKTSSEASREAFHFVNSPLDERFSIITVEYQEQHQAVDLPAVMDAPIFAVADGTVQKAVPDDDAYSKYVLLDHHNGFMTLYAVCNEILVQEGDEVTAGQEIAKVGTTGNVNGPILHFELRHQNGEKLDPTPLLAEVLK